MRICFQSFFTKRPSKQSSLNYVSCAIQNFINTRYPFPITKTLALTIERSHTACNVDNLYIILEILCAFKVQKECAFTTLKVVSLNAPLNKYLSITFLALYKTSLSPGTPLPITKTLALNIESSHTTCNVDKLYIILIYNNNELSCNLNEKSQYCKIVSLQAYLY